MNENRYSPPSARVADQPPSADSKASGALAWATKLLWISLALALVAAALQWAYLPDTPLTRMGMSALLFTVAVLGFLTYYIGRGRNWARIILLILGILGLPSLLQLPTVFPQAPLLGSVSILRSLLQFAALYIVFATSARHAFTSAND